MAETATPSQYCTRAELGLYGLPAAALSGVANATQDGFLQGASGIVDSYLTSRFDVPLTTWGIDMVMATASIAAYLLVKQHGFNMNSEDGKNIRQGYEDAVAWLRDVASGKATPSGASNIDSTTTPVTAERVYAVAPATGSIDARSGSFMEKETDDSVAVGTVGEPRLRGW